MNQKIFLVTGGNKGIGREIVKQLAERGHRVYFSSRDIVQGEQARSELSPFGDVRVLKMDLNDIESQRAAADQILKDAGYLDGLINNAGICTDYSPPTATKIEDLRSHFETNFFGVVMVTQTMLPLLRAGRGRVIVNVSTGLASLGLQGETSWPYRGANLLAYNSSKTALNMFTVSLAKELRGEGFRVNSVNPGHIATDLGGHDAPGTVEQGAVISVKCALDGSAHLTGLFLADGGVVPW